MSNKQNCLCLFEGCELHCLQHVLQFVYLVKHYKFCDAIGELFLAALYISEKGVYYLHSENISFVNDHENNLI